MALKNVTLTLRLPADMARKVGEIARLRGVSRSELVRRQFQELIDASSGSAEKTVYEQFAPWIGIIDSGGKFPARNSRKHFREYIEEKHRARRPR